MSQENVEIVRRVIDAYNRGQEALDLFDPEIEWITTGRFVEPDTYQGHDEVRRYLQALRDDFEDLHVEPHELVDAGDHVITPVRFTGRGRLSSAPIDQVVVRVVRVLESTHVLAGGGADSVRPRRVRAAVRRPRTSPTSCHHERSPRPGRSGHNAASVRPGHRSAAVGSPARAARARPAAASELYADADLLAR